MYKSMKHIIKKYRATTFLIALFAFSLHINAVFEGRNEQLNQYTEVRTQVEIAPMDNNQKAAGYETPPGDKDFIGDEPVSDSSLFILLLGGFGCGFYIFRGYKDRG